MEFEAFHVTNYRNIHDSGRIEVGRITAFVGQNESGKSNLFEALCRVNPFDKQAKYNVDEDWPVDRWGDKDAHAQVCVAEFELTMEEIESLFDHAIAEPDDGQSQKNPRRPSSLTLYGARGYVGEPSFYVSNGAEKYLDSARVTSWAKENVPKFVYVYDYEMSGSQIELNALQKRIAEVSWDQLTSDEQIISVVLDLAKIDLDDFLAKGDSPTGRTTRSFDKRAASAYLTKQFQELWEQKDVSFDIEIDATTLNIFAEDKVVGMPVRLSRRSTGFRWYVAFAWKFTHASKGEFRDCILLLEEPGIHLHYSAQRDLLKAFERLKEGNSILYTTHLASMVDLGFPERIRMVENLEGSAATVKTGVVSSQKAPMAVIEMCLGLTGSMSGLLGNRKSLIVEGGFDSLILNKLKGVLRAGEAESLSESIYLWPADGAPNAPMYAAFAIGQNWQSGVLLDTDAEGKAARKKIKELYLDKLAEEEQNRFRILMIGEAAGIKKTDAAIEDLFPDQFYLELVNDAYGLAIQLEDLPVDGSTMITKRIEHVLRARHGRSELDKSLVLIKMLQRFDGWSEPKDLPTGTVTKAEKLFKAINRAFEHEEDS
jgi:energy-coupling factor transporter ATP-binding protein EcfA2